MKNVSIVILNYLNYKDTIQCIESLNNDDYPNKSIIIVDNGSTNDSWRILNKLYKDKEIHLIESKENLGFAKGNNLGIKYAREQLKASFILVVNNDTIFEDSRLITEMMNAYDDGVGVIGPRIVEANRLEQNPIPLTVNKLKVEERRNQLINSKNNMKMNIKESFIYKILKKFKYKILRMDKDRYPSTKISDNICSEYLVLHGACFLLTEDYFKYYDKLFPGTFLYYEENILTLITKKVNLKKKFINEVWIYHKEDMSSIMSFNNSSKVKKEYELDSIDICLEILDLSYSEIINNYFI